MKKLLPVILLILISIDVFAQAAKTKKTYKTESQEATIEETVNWLNEKFKTSIILAFSHEKKCIHNFDIKVNNTEITAIRRHSCDGVSYEITYTIPFKSLDSIDVNEQGRGPSYISSLSFVINCAGGNSCIKRQYKDFIANTSKTTYISSFDSYSAINIKCMNTEIRERIINAINHAIWLNGGGKVEEKF